MKITILYSGGLDSRILYHYAKKTYPDAEVTAVYYKHGCDSEASEISRLPDFVKIRTLDWLGSEIQPLSKKSDPFASNIYIPGRNLVFAALAACQELPDEVWMGTLVDENNDQATDKNEMFRNKTSELLSYVLSPFKDSITLRFPFVELNFTKRDSVKWALENGLDQEELKKTTSCWHNHNGIQCGKCKQCLKRDLVFLLNGIQEEYEVDPFTDPEQILRMKEYLKVYEEGSANADEKAMAEMIIEYQEKKL